MEPVIVNMPSQVKLAAVEYQHSLEQLAGALAQLGIYVTTINVGEVRLHDVHTSDRHHYPNDKSVQLYATSNIEINMSNLDLQSVISTITASRTMLDQHNIEKELRENNEDLQELWEIYEATKILKVQDAFVRNSTANATGTAHPATYSSKYAP